MAPIFWKNKLLLLKAESSYGVDPTPTGSANAILATNIVLSPMEGDDISRELELPYMGGQPMIPVGVHTRVQFRIELAPSGAAGTVPAWGAIIKALGCSETIVPATSVTYRPVSTGHSSATLWIWHGATKFIMNGARGTARMRWTAQQLPYLEVDIRGTFNAPAEASQLSPTYTAFQAPGVVRNAITTFEIDDDPFVMRELIMDMGNQVEQRLLVGSESIIIPDRSDALSIKVEAVPLTTFNPFASTMDQERHEIVLVHGVTAGRITTFTAPNTQLKRLTGFENQQNILEWPLEGVPLPTSGNDQWSLALT